MFKKENFTTILFAIIMATLIGLTIFGFVSKEKETETTQEQTESSGTLSISPDADPLIGESNAPVEIINFSDLNCPWCAKWEQEVLPKLKEDFINNGDAVFTLKNFPFLKEGSTTGALAGEAIYHQDEEAFWKYLNLMLANQEETKEEGITHDYIMNLARENIEGLDYDLLSKDIKEETYITEVNEDKQTGVEFGVTGTPSIFINGEKVDDPFDYNSIKTLIEKNLE